MARPLTWHEYLQLQGLYGLAVRHDAEARRYQLAAADLLAVTQDPYESTHLTRTAAEVALDLVQDGMSYDGAEALDKVLQRFDVEIPDVPELEPDPVDELLDRLSAMATDTEQIRKGEVSALNRLAGIADEIRVHRGEASDG